MQVWVGERKVGAIGIQISRGVVLHGVSLNVNTDLSWFEKIVPCGERVKQVTSMSLLLRRKELPLPKIQECLSQQLSVRFGHDSVVPVSPSELLDQVYQLSAQHDSMQPVHK
jgi:lipoyl(octanoyl) transferase